MTTIPSVAPAKPPTRPTRRTLRVATSTTLLWLAATLTFATFATGLLAQSTTTLLTARGALTAIGQLSGLASINLMLLQIALMLRIPALTRHIALDRPTGHPSATHLHRDLSTWVFALLATHILAFLAATNPNLLAAIGDLWTIRDLALAFIATAALCCVGITSLRAIRTRLPHELWLGLHLAAYPALALSIPHMFTQGLLATGWPRTLWILYLATLAAAFLYWRVLSPLTLNLAHRLRVATITQETPVDFTITFDGRHLAALGAHPGDHLHLRFLAPGLWWHQHPLSLSRDPALGLAVTMRVWVSVPQGPRVPDDGRDVVLVGAGAGIGPMVSVAQAVCRTSPPSRRIALVARVSRLEDVPDMAGLPYWVSVGPR